MTTVVLGELSALDELLARRRALGQDLFDEVWTGVYHVAPAPNVAHGQVDRQLAALLHTPARSAGLVATGPFNLGGPEDYRVPDGGYLRGRPVGIWQPTAAIVVEVVSPDDESYAKFDFYAAHHVDEVVIADPLLGRVRIWVLHSSGYSETSHSQLLNVAAADLVEQIDWPPI